MRCRPDRSTAVAGDFAIPAIYSVNSRQHIVIACGGGRMGSKSGDAWMALALPEWRSRVELAPSLNLSTAWSKPAALLQRGRYAKVC